MKTNLINVNLINAKADISNTKPKKRNNVDFEVSIEEKGKEINKKDQKYKKDEVYEVNEEKNEEVSKEISKEDENDEDKNENIDEYQNINEEYIYILQKLNKFDEINSINQLEDKEIDNTKQLNIYKENNIKINDISIDEVINENKVETLDIQYINNIEENNLFKYVYDISYTSSSKESINFNNIYELDERIEINNDTDILSKISMTDQNNLFGKNNFIKSEDKDLQNLLKSNVENNLNDETIKNIKLMKTEDIKELSIKLRPRELGDMHIKLLQENDTLKAVITVTDKDVYNLINKNISDLKQHLEAFNVKEIGIVVDSDNNYSSDSFDKNFEEHRNKNDHESSKKSKNKQENHISIEKDDIHKKDNGLNLLA